jgi:hypothetical protein
MKLLLTSDSANSADGSRAPYFRGKRAGNWNETLFNACYDREGTVRPGWYEANDGLKNKNGDLWAVILEVQKIAEEGMSVIQGEQIDNSSHGLLSSSIDSFSSSLSQASLKESVAI